MSAREKSFFYLNGQKILFQNVLNNKVISTSNFERDLLDFIKLWYSEEDKFVFKSSGSTGAAKELEVTRGQITSSIYLTKEALHLTEKDKALICLPVSSTGGKMMLARALELNMEMECVEPSINPFGNLTLKPTFTALTPYQLEGILNENEEVLNDHKAIIIGGAPVSDVLKHRIKNNIKSPVYATYGMTESVSHIALQLLNTKNASSSFKLLPKIEIKTTSEDCLQIKGPVTGEKWITTTDRVQLLSEKEFIWLGRSDNTINSGGIKIQPEESEKIIASIFDDLGIKRRFFILGIPHQTLGQVCSLVIEGPPIEGYLLGHIKAQLDNKMPKYHIPKEIFTITEFIYTNSGKIDRLKTADFVL